MPKLRTFLSMSVACYWLIGCAAHVIDGVSSESRSEGAVIFGEGHGAGRVFLNVVPGASRVVGDKAPGIPNALKIKEIDGRPISPNQGDEYWIKEGTYSFLITCEFKNFQGYLNSATGSTEAAVLKGKEYIIQGELEVIGQYFNGNKKYKCNTAVVEKT